MGSYSSTESLQYENVSRQKAMAMMQVVVFNPEKVIDVSKIDELGKVQVMSQAPLSWNEVNLNKANASTGFDD